jgi:hypothetical protein
MIHHVNEGESLYPGLNWGWANGPRVVICIGQRILYLRWSRAIGPQVWWR